MTLALLLLQLTVILVVARGCGLLLRAFGQPMVIGEMTAGILLGPIVFGALFPQWHAQLFPAASLQGLSSLASLGIVLFMFVVGAELRAPSGMAAQALGAAGVVDSLAWVLLALVVALASSGSDSGFQGFFRISFGLAVLVAVVFLVVRPLLARMLRVHAPEGLPTPMVLAALMIGLFVCAMVTEWLHLHAVFGAFLFGVSLPRDDRLLKQSLATGTLMNSRGLMELIAIKVGLDAGLIGPELFTMLLIMALVTTAATGPLLTLIARRGAPTQGEVTS